MPASILSSGAGSLAYAIDAQAPVKTGCSFQVTANETGSLDLEISFHDAAYGALTVTVDIANYSSARYLYSVSSLSLKIESGTFSGSWMGAAGSSGVLLIRNISTTYIGSLTAAGLVWQGTGTQPPLAIHLTQITLSAAAADAASPAASATGTDGWVTSTYNIRTGQPQTAFANAGVWLVFGNYLSIAATWNDSVFGSLYVLVTFVESGTGIYDSSEIEIDAEAVPYTPSPNGYWNNSIWPTLTAGIVVNLICTTVSSGTLMQASVSIQQLPWIPAPPAPDQAGLDVLMSVFANVPASS